MRAVPPTWRKWDGIGVTVGPSPCPCNPQRPIVPSHLAIPAITRQAGEECGLDGS